MNPVSPTSSRTTAFNHQLAELTSNSACKPRWQKFSQAVVHGAWSMDSPLSAEAVQDLADWLASSPAELRLLNLTEKLPAGGMPILFEALKVNTTLNHLNLCDNLMDVSGAAALSDLLKANRSLRTLTIRSCGIDDAMMGQLSEALYFNAGIEDLTISNSCFGDDGLIALSKALTSNNTLVILQIDQCIADKSGPRFTDSGVAALADALKSNGTLVQVRLDNAEIDEHTWASLLSALSVNASIRRLDLCDRNLSGPNRQLLESLLACNATLVETGDLGSDARSGLLKMAAERYSVEVMDMVFKALIKMPSIPGDDRATTLRSLATLGKVSAADAAGASAQGSAPGKQERL